MSPSVDMLLLRQRKSTVIGKFRDCRFFFKCELEGEIKEGSEKRTRKIF